MSSCSLATHPRTARDVLTVCWERQGKKYRGCGRRCYSPVTMAFQTYIFLAHIVVTWLLYLVLSFTCSVIRMLVWWRNGTWKQLRDSRKPENYSKSAHKKTIIFHHRFDPFIETRPSDAIVMHHSFVSPEYVLRDDVHLMQVTDSEAMFVQKTKGSRGPDLYPFCVFGYNADAKHVITMPLESLHELADSMEKNDAKIIFLQNQARCGGTLFTEVFKATDRCITFCEPHPLNAACKFYYIKKKWNRPTMIRMLKSIVHLQCKPRKSLPEKTLAYVMKPTAMSMIFTDILQEAIPEATQFFIYRNPIEVGISLRRAAEGIDSLRLMFHLPQIPKMHAPLMAQLGYTEVDFRGWTPKVSQEIEWGYRLAASTMKYYLEYRERGVAIHGIRYRIFRDNQKEVTEKIFDICGMPKSLVGKATEAFGRDSQEESPISMAKLKRLMPVPPKASPEVLEAAREMSKDLGVPGPDVWDDPNFALPGTLLP